jgi:hypothetical protein
VRLDAGGGRLAIYQCAPDAAPWRPRFVKGPSDLASALGIHLVMVNNTAPEREEQFNAWYNDEHLGEVMAAGGYRAGTRYERTAPTPGGARWLALYEIDRPDPLAGRDRVVAATPGMRLWPHLDVVQVAVYGRVEEEAG